MKYHSLGRTGVKISAIGLGTMTWGEQNSEAHAHEQLDYALSQGVTFIDTAEMYPVPPKAETQGRTEAYIGSWLRQRRNRAQIILATKITGPGDFPYMRGGAKLDRKSVLAACDTSLSRLQTDYIDLFQIHWPERNTNYFGKLNYTPRDDSRATPIEETLVALGELVKQGKARHVGISNETPWGVSEYLRLHDKGGPPGLPRIVSIQNPYNLLNRSFEIGLAEFAHREQVGLLAYSPLAFGVLSGKYLDGARPAASRLTLFSRFARYTGAQAEAATREYVALAGKHGLDAAQMALAFINSRPFVTSNLVGATTLEQLRSNIASIALTLSKEVTDGIEAIHRQFSNPCP